MHGHYYCPYIPLDQTPTVDLCELDAQMERRAALEYDVEHPIRPIYESEELLSISWPLEGF